MSFVFIGKDKGEIFYNENLVIALEKAQSYAGDNGYVASLPQIINERTCADFDSNIWTNIFTANSEENIGKTSQKNLVVLTIHGGGILTPKFIKKKERTVFNISRKEFLNALEGKMSDGSEIPIYSFNDFKKINLQNLPIRYGVINDFKERKKNEAYQENQISDLNEINLIIVRYGGEELKEKYLKKISKKFENKHTLPYLCPTRSRGFFLSLSELSSDFSIISNNCLLANCLHRIDPGCFIGVKGNFQEATETYTKKDLNETYTKKDLKKALENLKLSKFEEKILDELNRK